MERRKNAANAVDLPELDVLWRRKLTTAGSTSTARLTADSLARYVYCPYDFVLFDAKELTVTALATRFVRIGNVDGPLRLCTQCIYIQCLGNNIFDGTILREHNWDGKPQVDCSIWAESPATTAAASDSWSWERGRFVQCWNGEPFIILQPSSAEA